jgi:hypothetical protein
MLSMITAIPTSAVCTAVSLGVSVGREVELHERGIFKRPATLTKLQEDTVMDSTVISGGHTDIGMC